jgi:hypothetical protein
MNDKVKDKAKDKAKVKDKAKDKVKDKAKDKAKVTDKVRSNKEDFSWRYAILKSGQGEETVYSVCEEFTGIGYTEAITPYGETLEDLVVVLVMMLGDVKQAIKDNNIIIEDGPYDSWLSEKLSKEDFIPIQNVGKWLEDIENEVQDFDEDK